MSNPGTGGGSSGAPASLSRRPITIYDKNVQRRRNEVSLSAFAYLFSEAVHYAHRKSKGISDLEELLNTMGCRVGERTLEMVALREGKVAKREIKLLGILQLINTSVWRILFGRQADSMQVSNEDASQYMIIDHNPLVTEFISVPRDMSQLDCAAFVAGIIEAIMVSSLFPAKVSAHSMGTPEHPNRTVFLVRLDESVMKRINS